MGNIIKTRRAGLDITHVNAQYLPSYRFDKKSYMTLNGKMAFILHYFTEFVYDVVVIQLLGLPRF